MRVTFVVSSYAMAGMEMRVARMAGLAADRGHAVDFGCPRGSPLDGLLAERGIGRFALRLHGSLDLPGCARLTRRLRASGSEVVMAFNGKDYWMSIAAARLAGIPAVINRSTANAVKSITVPVMKLADRIVAVSRGIADVLVGQGIPGSLVEVVYLGVNGGVFSPDRGRPREEIRESLGLPRDAFIAGCFGRSSKGQRQLLEADGLLGPGCERTAYFFAGEHIPERLGPFVAERPSLAGRVFLRDLVPYGEVPDHLACLDIVVMLPEREPFSNAVLEAMAMERPVVLSRTLGNIEAVEEGVTGFLVGHDDVPAVAAKVRELCLSPARRAEMGRAAGARARALFTEEVMMEGLERVWRDSAGGGDAPEGR